MLSKILTISRNVHQESKMSVVAYHLNEILKVVMKFYSESHSTKFGKNLFSVYQKNIILF